MSTGHDPKGLDTVEIKAFVPARDFELSKRFYADLGFQIPCRRAVADRPEHRGSRRRPPRRAVAGVRRAV